jgi:hypothetical protein
LVHLAALFVFLRVPLLLPKLLLFDGDSFESESLLLSLLESESLAETSDPFLDFGRDELLLLPDKLLPSLLFLQDCAECGLPG